MKDAILRRVNKLTADILEHGLTVLIDKELRLNPSAEELDRLVSEYGLVLDALGEYAFGKPSSPDQGFSPSSHSKE